MVKYNKNGTATKGKRLLHSGGPRDRQRKLAEQDRLRDLEHLQDELKGMTPTMSSNGAGYSKDQVHEMINESISEVSVELEKKYVEQIEHLNNELKSKDIVISQLTSTVTKLEDTLDKRDNMIMELTNKVTAIGSRGYVAQPTEEIEDSARPSMDKVFIDPSAKGAEKKFESHMKAREEKSTKSSVSSSVDKLKSLMGTKLPKI